MIASIIFYVLFALTLSTLGKMEWVTTNRLYNRTGVYSNRWSVYTVLLLAIFILLCGLRYRTGVDCESYVETLKTGKAVDSREDFELFFGWIVRGLRSLGANRVIYLGILASLEIIPFYYALRSRKFLYQFVGLLLILGPFFLFWMNGIRQCIAACFFVLAAVNFLDKGKKGKFVAALVITVAAQFHTSAYALLLFLIIPNKDYFRNRLINIAILIACAVIGQTHLMNTYLERFIGVEFEGAYELYLRHTEDFLVSESTMGYGPRRIVLLIVTLVTLWYAPGMKEQFKSDPLFLFSFNLFFIHACLGDNLLSNVHYIFRRPFYYTQPFMLISFSYLLYYLKYFNKARNKQIVYLSVTAFACLYMIIECLATAGNNYETSLYKLYIGQ